MEMAIYFIVVLVMACLIMSHTMADESGYRRGLKVGEDKFKVHLQVINSKLDKLIP